MATFVRTNPKPTNDKNFKNKMAKTSKKEEGRQLTFQERKEKKYPFDDDDVQGIFDELMVAKAISLPKRKRPVVANITNDPKY